MSRYCSRRAQVLQIDEPLRGGQWRLQRFRLAHDCDHLRSPFMLISAVRQQRCVPARNRADSVAGRCLRRADAISDRLDDFGSVADPDVFEGRLQAPHVRSTVSLLASAQDFSRPVPLEESGHGFGWIAEQAIALAQREISCGWPSGTRRKRLWSGRPKRVGKYLSMI